MFMRTAGPAESPLPWDDRPGRANRDSVGDFALDAAAVDRFDQLLHEIHPQARHVDADRIASLGRWLQDLPIAEARAVLDECLSRIERLRAMPTGTAAKRSATAYAACSPTSTRTTT